MKYKYIAGAVVANLYRLLRVFPNSDPIMGFVIPAAKNEKWWKAPLFAFATMFVFDFFTSGIGVWTWITAGTYSVVALGAKYFLNHRKSSIASFLSAGAIGVIVFDAITGPIMSTFIFNQPIIITTLGQVPFTVMHLVSASFGILIVSPFYDTEIMNEMIAIKNSVKKIVLNRGIAIE